MNRKFCIFVTALDLVWMQFNSCYVLLRLWSLVSCPFQLLFSHTHIIIHRHDRIFLTLVLVLCIWSGYLQAEPQPEITWLRDDEPLSPWIQVINTEGMSQLVIPSSKRSDSAIYTIKAKNSVGEAFFDVEVRVTGEFNMSGFTDWLVHKHCVRLCAGNTGRNKSVLTII